MTVFMEMACNLGVVVKQIERQPFCVLQSASSDVFLFDHFVYYARFQLGRFAACAQEAVDGDLWFVGDFNLWLS